MGTITHIISISCFFFKKFGQQNKKGLLLDGAFADLVRFGAAPKINVNMWHAFGKKGAADSSSIVSHTIHVWYIYLHLANLYGKCR